MKMDTSLTRPILLCLGIIVVSNPAYSQIQVTNDITSSATVGPTITHPTKENRIRWTWQLPRTIKKAFNQTPFCAWYIEKMVSYNYAGKTVYQFSVNNSSLLDSDHYDCFLEKSFVTVSDNEITVRADTSK
jgi:hypothetical protein